MVAQAVQLLWAMALAGQAAGSATAAAPAAVNTVVLLVIDGEFPSSSLCDIAYPPSGPTTLATIHEDSRPRCILG